MREKDARSGEEKIEPHVMIVSTHEAGVLNSALSFLHAELSFGIVKKSVKI